LWEQKAFGGFHFEHIGFPAIRQLYVKTSCLCPHSHLGNFIVFLINSKL